MQMLHGQLLNFSFWSRQSSFAFGVANRAAKKDDNKQRGDLVYVNSANINNIYTLLYFTIKLAACLLLSVSHPNMADTGWERLIQTDVHRFCNVIPEWTNPQLTKILNSTSLDKNFITA
jgi:hypothetical protein